MNPYLRICEKYAREMPKENFPVLIAWHLENGFVFSTPEFFIMGREVLKSSGADSIRSLDSRPASQECDCWYIHAMAGNMEKAWTILPRWLPWLAFDRMQGGKLDLRFVPAESIRGLCLSL